MKLLHPLKRNLHAPFSIVVVVEDYVVHELFVVYENAKDSFSFGMCSIRNLTNSSEEIVCILVVLLGAEQQWLEGLHTPSMPTLWCSLILVASWRVLIMELQTMGL
jgi:hypothetical protein